MTELHARLGAAIDDDRARFSGPDFAQDRLDSVLGSVKRRRAVRAAGVSSVSLVGASALAVSAVNVPWGSFALGAAPGGSPTVTCTTSTPAAAPSDAGADSLIVTTFAGTPTPAESETSPDGVTKSTDGDPGQASWGIALAGEYGDDGVVAKVERDGRALIVSVSDGSEQRVEPDADGSYHVTLASGESYVITLDSSLNELEIREWSVVDGDAIASPTPSVDCVTTTPEPSESASPAPSEAPTVSASPSAEPSIEPSAEADTVAPTWIPTLPDGVPFACGFEFPALTFGDQALGVTAEATTDSAIRAIFAEWYGEQAPTTDVADTGATGYHAIVSGPNPTEHSVSTRDPNSDESLAELLENELGELGLTFVAVEDGKVVGTVVPGESGETPGVVVDGAGGDAPLEGFLWDLEALTPCGASSLEGAEIYAVAGYGDAGVLTYAWSAVD